MPDFTTADGVRLAYHDSGAGPPVVLVAGYTAPAETWALQTPPLLAAGYRVLALDRRSHGRSEDTLAGQRMARHGKDLVEFLYGLGLDGVALVGSSMGASAMWAAADLDPLPQVRAWVSVDQTPKMVNEGDWQHGFYGLTTGNAIDFFAAGIPDTGRGYTAEQAAARGPRIVDAVGFQPPFREPNAPETRLLLRDHAVQDWRDVIARLAAPALFVAGQDSEYWPAGHAAAAASLNRRAAFLAMRGAGHAPHWDDPEGFNGALLGFLASPGAPL